MPFRVGLIGPESCGKSTIGRYLSRRYNEVTYVDEYERTYFETHDLAAVTYEDVEAIAREQIRRQRETTDDVVVFDSDLLMIRIWMDVQWGKHPEWVDQALQDYPMDVYLLFYPDLPWKDDPTRSRGSDEERKALFDLYEREIQALDIPYYIIRTKV